MNKTLRRYRSYRCENQQKSKYAREDSPPDIQRRSPEIKILKDSERPMKNRCCLVHPKQCDFSQVTEWDSEEDVTDEQTNRFMRLLDQGFDSIVPNALAYKINELKKKIYGNVPMVDVSSQHNEDGSLAVSKFVETTGSFQWQKSDNIHVIDNSVKKANKATTPNKEQPSRRIPDDIQISEIPKVKIIAKKFSKYKRDNVELRRLEEKVVCVEYDVYEEGTNSNTIKPIQKMRAFFSIKPVYDAGSDPPLLAEVPSKIKHKFNILDEDLKKLTEKEIEIIDDKIKENKSYLDNLRRILKRTQTVNTKKDKTSLDLKSLYDMAKRDCHPSVSDSDSNFLTKSELQEVKNLVLQRCSSSVHGITRRRMKCPNDPNPIGSVFSGSIVSELLREDAKLNVFE